MRHRCNRIRSITCGVMLLVTGNLSRGNGSARLAVPDSAEVARGRSQVQQTFREDYAKRSPADRDGLAGKLLEAAGDGAEVPATRYALLQEAREIASSCGDVDLALRAADKLAAVFDVNPDSARVEALSNLSRHANRPSTAAMVVGRAMDLMDAAAESDDWDVINRLAAVAGASAGPSRAPGLAGRVDSRLRELRAGKAQYDRLRPALQTLKTNPNDPAANLELGQYYYLQKDRWDEGLALLAKGSDKALRKLAAEDRGVPDDAAAQVARGDAWFAAAATQPGSFKAIAQKRAVYWYGLARAGTLGLKKVQAEERIASCEKDLKSYSAQHPVLRAIDPARAEALRWAIETADTTPLTAGKIIEQKVWSASPTPYRITGTIQLSPALTIEPGAEVRGGTIDTGTTGHIIARGLPDRPIIFRQVKFHEDLNGTLTAENCVFDRCEFNKGGVWFAYNSSKWQFTNCLIYACKFGALDGVNYGFQIENCALASMDLPEIAHRRDKTNVFDHMEHLRKDWNRIQSCDFVDCLVPPTVFWCSESSNFEGCRFIPGEAFESSTPLKAVAYVADTVGESPQLVWAQAPAKKAGVEMINPGKPFPTITLTPELSVPEVFVGKRIEVLTPHARSAGLRP